jgi:hypothetical protein
MPLVKKACHKIEYSNISSSMNNTFYFLSIYPHTNKIGLLNSIAIYEQAHSAFREG